MLRVTVDDEESMPKIKGALPMPSLGDVRTKIVELSSEAITSGINTTLSAIYAMIENLPPEPKEHEVSEICFKLLIDAKGEVSLLSALKGTLTGQSAIEFKIKRKRMADG